MDIPLNKEGHDEIAQAIECLQGRSLVALYSSMCRAAQETAELIGRGLKLKPKALERLQNLDHGLWQGMCIEEVKRKQPKVYKQWQEHPENVCPPNGEMLSAVIERTDVALDKLFASTASASSAWLRRSRLASVIRSRLQGTDVGDLWKAANGCGRVEVFEVSASPASTQAKRDQVSLQKWQMADDKQ